MPQWFLSEPKIAPPFIELWIKVAVIKSFESNFAQTLEVLRFLNWRTKCAKFEERHQKIKEASVKKGEIRRNT